MEVGGGGYLPWKNAEKKSDTTWYILVHSDKKICLKKENMLSALVFFGHEITNYNFAVYQGDILPNQDTYHTEIHEIMIICHL